jgi:hypothetical protein
VNVNKEPEISQKEVLKGLYQVLIFMLIRTFNVYKLWFMTAIDFLFQRYKWYRMLRPRYAVKMMPICYGDMRNHVKPRWKIFTKIDTDYKFKREFEKYQEKYFILEVWWKELEIDVVKSFKVDQNKLKKYKRDAKIDSLLR